MSFVSCLLNVVSVSKKIFKKLFSSAFNISEKSTSYFLALTTVSELGSSKAVIASKINFFDLSGAVGSKIKI